MRQPCDQLLPHSGLSLKDLDNFRSLPAVRLPVLPTVDSRSSYRRSVCLRTRVIPNCVRHVDLSAGACPDAVG